MLHGIATQNNGKAMVLSFAEKHGHIKYMGISDLWMHKEDGCNGMLSANGKPGHFDCIVCGKAFKKQSMLSTQTDTRDARAKDLLSTVSLEHRNDKIGLIRFIVRSQSRPKAYLVMKDNHGNFSCGCEDWIKHKKYDDWHCKHIMAAELWLENEQQAEKERASQRRPSLICTGTQAEFEKVNSLDESQIVRLCNGDIGEFPLAYEINGKVAVSYSGTLNLAWRYSIKFSDIQVKDASDRIVATVKASNPQTGNTQVGAHSQPKRFDGGRIDPDAEVKAIEKAKRNAALKVLNEVDVYGFSNEHAKKPVFDYLDAYNECCKVFTHKGFGEWHVSDLVKELYPERKPAKLGRDEWVAIYRECQKHAAELENMPGVERSHWSKTTDGDVVLVTENGEKSPSPTCEFYDKGKCKRCLVPHPYLGIGHCNPKVACRGDANSDVCKRMQERYPSSFGITPPDDGKFYINGKFNPDYWKVGLDKMMGRA